MTQLNDVYPVEPALLSRRSFLVSSGALSVAVAFGVAPPVSAQGASVRPNAWIQVGSDGTVTIYSPAAEMGQGVKTAMPLLVAEDMDLDWSKVRILQAPSEPKNFGNPLFGGGMSAGASRTARGYYELLRLPHRLDQRKDPVHARMHARQAASIGVHCQLAAGSDHVVKCLHALVRSSCRRSNRGQAEHAARPVQLEEAALSAWLAGHGAVVLNDLNCGGMC